MLPEENIAQYFLSKQNLKFPVNLELLLSKYAVVEEDNLPSGFDAITLKKPSQHNRPLVIINKKLSSARRLFTVGHELGHIVIPWHYGTQFFCKINGIVSLEDRLADSIESEANRFAAELIMPESWINKLIVSYPKLDNLVNYIVQFRGVSFLAASFRLINLLPEGYAFTETDFSNKVINVSTSHGTRLKLPEIGSKFDFQSINLLADDTATFKTGTSTITWWHLNKRIIPSDSTSIAESASDILHKICIETSIIGSEMKNKISTINGIIGAANGSNKDQHDLFTVLKQRFINRDSLKPIIQHPLFDSFLCKRIQSIKSKKNI